MPPPVATLGVVLAQHLTHVVGLVVTTGFDAAADRGVRDMNGTA